MRRAPLLLRFAAAAAMAAAPVFGIAAQGAATGKPIQLEDYARFNRIAGTALSADGKWMTFTYTPNENGASVMHIKQLDGDKDYVLTMGGGRGGAAASGGGRGGAGGGGTSFSDDSKYAAYNVPAQAGGRGAAGGAPAPGGRGGRGGRGQPQTPQNGRGAADENANVTHLEILNLATGEKQAIPNAASWRFSPGSKYLVVRLSAAGSEEPAAAPAGGGGRGGRGGGGGPAPSGAGMLIRDMATGVDRYVGNVSQFEFNDDGALLAYTVASPEKLGNGVYLLDPATGTTRILNTSQSEYEGLTWNSDGSGLTVLRGDKGHPMKQKSNVLLAWTGVDRGAGKELLYDPSKDEAFPKGFVLSEYSTPRFSRDGSRVFVGIKEQEEEVAPADSNKADVNIWHYKDQTAQSVQIVQIAQLRRATYPAVVFVNSGKFIRLGDDAMRTVTPAANSNVAIGRNDAAYRGEVAWGGSRADLYKVDINSGAKSLIAKALSRTYGTSPDSKWFLYLENKQLKAFSLDNGQTSTLDASTVPGKSYVNDVDDHAYEKPIWGVGGWTKDNKVLLYDQYDVWATPLDGGKATNLTQGVGTKEKIVFRVVRFGGGGGGGGRGGRGGGGAAGDSDLVDLSQPVTLSAYGDRTKKFGYYKVTAGQAPAPIIYVDKNVGGVIKATGADRIVFTEQDYNEFPDYWMSNSAFASPKKVTEANPFLSTGEFAWPSGKVLIDYKDRFGHQLQATLTLPAGYVKGKQYPMLVEFYELMSNTHHNFPIPGYGDSPSVGVYASNGYAVLQPDIVYEIGKPGTSAVDCLTAAVKAAIAAGYADPKHIGLHGHSWGGYQSSFVVTQTNIFAAVVTGAPPTNLTSFYDELYKSTGTVQQGITTVGQVRLGANVDPWKDTKMFEEQSPIFHVKNITTPFMILQGEADGAVDYV